MSSKQIALKIREIEAELVRVRHCNDTTLTHEERMQRIWELQLRLRTAHARLVEAVENESLKMAA